MRRIADEKEQQALREAEELKRQELDAAMTAAEELKRQELDAAMTAATEAKANLELLEVLETKKKELQSLLLQYEKENDEPANAGNPIISQAELEELASLPKPDKEEINMLVSNISYSPWSQISHTAMLFMFSACFDSLLPRWLRASWERVDCLWHLH